MRRGVRGRPLQILKVYWREIEKSARRRGRKRRRLTRRRIVRCRPDKGTTSSDLAPRSAAFPRGEGRGNPRPVAMNHRKRPGSRAYRGEAFAFYAVCSRFSGKISGKMRRFSGPKIHTCTRKAKIRWMGIRVTTDSSIRPKRQWKRIMLMQLAYRHMTGHMTGAVNPVRRCGKKSGSPRDIWRPAPRQRAAPGKIAAQRPGGLFPGRKCLPAGTVLR